MAYLLIANLILWAVLAVAAAAFGIQAYRKHHRSQRGSSHGSDPANDYAPRRNWRGGIGKLNYSSFVYFDLDRDGRYSLGDRPMSGIAARLTNVHGHVRTSRTNGNGFANFTMSAGRRSAHIGTPGAYQFAVSVPPGWVCTSGNAMQAQEFRLIEGSPAGMGSEEMLKPVGLAPLRTLSGRTAGAGATISLMGAGQRIGGEAVAADADFRIDVPDGTDAVEIEGAGLARKLALSPYPTHLGMLSRERPPIEAAAGLKTIGFDDLTSRGLRKIPSGYAGLNWFNLNAMSRDFANSNDGYVNGNTSGDHICYTSSGHPAELWREEPFGFHSVMISAAWAKSEGETARIESWQGDTLVKSEDLVVSALTPIHYAPMLKGITRIRFSSKHCWQLVIDDLVLAL